MRARKKLKVWLTDEKSDTDDDGTENGDVGKKRNQSSNNARCKGTCSLNVRAYKVKWLFKVCCDISHYYIHITQGKVDHS